MIYEVINFASYIAIKAIHDKKMKAAGAKKIMLEILIIIIIIFETICTK